MKTVTITPKFQVHIPVSIRKQIGLTKHGKAKIEVQKGKILITPIDSSIEDLAGKYHKYWKKNPIPVEKIRDYIDYGDL